MDPQLQELIERLRDLVPALQKLGSTAGTTVTGVSSDRSTDRIIAALAKLSVSMDTSIKTRAAEQKSMESFTKAVDKSADAQEDYRKKQKAASDAITEAAKQQAQAAKLAAMTDKELADEKKQQNKDALKQEYESVRNRRDINTNYAALVAREQIEQRRAGNTFRSGLEKLGGESVAAQKSLIYLQGALETFGKLGSAAGTFAKELGEGNTKFTILNPLIDTVANALGKMAEAIPFAGSAISGGMKLVAEGTKFIINQLQQSIETFQELSDVGALTTNGMSGVQKGFLESGLSLQGYKKIITQNATTLAQFGGTVGEGRDRFTKFVGSIVDSEAGDSLRRLGMSSDQIGESAAGFTAQQTRLGLAQNKSQSQLRAGAIEYAKELDLLTKLTGKNRASLQAQQDAALSEGRFRAVTDEMIANGQGKQAKAMLDFQSMVNSVAPDVAAGLRDVATGNVTSAAAQKLFNDTQGQGINIMRQLQSGEIDQVEAFKRLQSAIGDNIGTSRSLAKAMGDDIDVYNKYAQKSDLLNAKIIDGQVQLEKAQKDQMTKGTDPLTDSAVNAQKNLEQMSRQIQNFGFTVMPDAATAVNKFTDALNDFIKGVSKATGIALPTITRAGGAEPPPSTPVASTALPPATQARINTQQAVESAQTNREKLEKAKGRDSADVTEARIAEMKARDEAARARMAEITAQRNKARGIPTPGAVPAPASGTAPGATVPAPGNAKAPAGGAAMPAPLTTAGLRIKSPESTAGGEASPKLIALAHEIQKALGSDLLYFSAFNDSYHRGPNSKHTKGQALDFTLTDPSQAAQIVDMIRGLPGVSKVLDEYNYPSPGATGKHIHAEVSAAKGGIFNGPATGYPAILHKREAIVPLPDGKSIPVEFKDINASSGGADMITTFVDEVSRKFAGMMPQSVASTDPALVALMSDLVSLQRSNNSTQQRLLQVTQA